MAADDVVRNYCTTISTSIFTPSSSVILEIIQGNPTTVITFTPYNFVDGTIVRLSISPNCGMQQINQKTAVITVVDAVTFNIAIDSTLFDPFVIPEDINDPGHTFPQQQPCSFVIPIGEVNAQLNMAVQNILP